MHAHIIVSRKDRSNTKKLQVARIDIIPLSTIVLDMHSVSDELKEAVLKIYSRPEFSNANFLHFKDILSADFGIQLSYSALSSILKNAGFESPKKKKIRHRTHRRKRKPHPGQLIQIDATPYEWFGGNIKYALHGAIDADQRLVIPINPTQNSTNL